MTGTSDPDAFEGGPLRLNGAKPGMIASELAEVIAEARESGRLPDHSVQVVLAERLALTADAAWLADEVAPFLSAVTKLQPLLVKLGLSSSRGGDDADDDGHSSSGAHTDALERELADILGSGPSVGDNPES